MTDVKTLTDDLCRYVTGVVTDDNEALFDRIKRELPLTLYRFRSGDTFNGWSVPDNWRVKRAEIRRDGKVVFDALGECARRCALREIILWHARLGRLALRIS